MLSFCVSILFLSRSTVRTARTVAPPPPSELPRNTYGHPTDIRTPTQGPALLLLHVLHITLAASLFLSATHTEKLVKSRIL